MASSYAYDKGEADELTLRLNLDSVNETLQLQLQEKLGKADLRVEETRLTHLANSPEIAQVSGIALQSSSDTITAFPLFR